MRALPKTKRDGRPDTTLTADELESALELLSTETETPASGRRALVIELVENVLVGCVFYGLLAGLLVIAFDIWWGLGLLAASAIAFVLLAIAPGSTVNADLTTLRSSIGDNELLKVAAEGWTKRQSWRNTVVVLFTMFVVLGGLVWLVYGLLVDGEVRVPALIVIALPSLVFWVELALDQLRELRYYERVQSIRSRFEHHARTAGEDDAEIAVSGAELDVLARAEAHQTQRAVDESVQQLPSVLAQSYAVSITPEAIEGLEELHQTSASDWLHVQQAIRSLQDDPRPSSAQPTTAVSAELRLPVGRHEVGYVVNEEKQSVYVHAIDATPVDRSSGDA